MESCRELYEYSFLIEEIRKGLRMKMELPDAVDRAVEVCIQEGVLKTFLLRHRAEVKNVILEEFDLNKQLSLERKEGENLFAALTLQLIADNRIEDLTRASTDVKYREILYKEYNLN